MTREKEIDIEATHYDYGYYEGDRISAYMCFRDGAEWADSNPKSPWISVDDDLPCNHEELITTDGYYEKETVDVVTISKSGIVDTNCMVLYNNGIWRWKYGVVPCYWMPIPKLPKE